MDDQRPLLWYAAPPARLPWLARMPRPFVLIVGAVVPGLAMWMMRGRAGFGWFCGLWGVVIFAFGFFGPLWGEVMFKDSLLKEQGLWPFLATCVAVAVTSAWAAVDCQLKLSRTKEQSEPAS